MPRGLIRALLSMGIFSALGAFGFASPSLSAQQEGSQGVFGEVTSIQFPSSGLAVILLNTPEGPLGVTSVETTAVTLPGLDVASAADIRTGDFLAVQARPEGQILEAQRILVKPATPVLTTHVVGAVAQAGLGQLVIVDGEGNRMAVDIAPELTAPSPGQIVTAVLRRDSRTAALSTSQVEPAEDSLGRLNGALQGAQPGETLENLKERFSDALSGHLSLMVGLSAHVPAEARPGLGRAIGAATRGFQQALSVYGLEGPFATVSGIVSLIDSVLGLVTVASTAGDAVDLTVTSETDITVEGLSADLSGLSLGHRVMAKYDPLTQKARTFDVAIGEVLGAELAIELLAEHARGEVAGTLSSANLTATPPIITLTPTRQAPITLRVSDRTRVLSAGREVSLDEIPLGAPLKVQFNPATNVALQVETVALRTGEVFIMGVVESLNRKLGRLVVFTTISDLPGGQHLGLIIDSSTVIERDGLIVPIAEVRLGDLVRPTSRYNTSNRVLARMALKSVPAFPVEGVVRGKLAVSAQKNRLTISTPYLETLTLNVTLGTRLTLQGEELAIEDLGVEDRVVVLYHPVSLEAIQINVLPPKVNRIGGTIVGRDEGNFTIVIETRNGEQVILRISKKTRVTDPNGRPAVFGDLVVGAEVSLAFYMPQTKEVVTLVLGAL